MFARTRLLAVSFVALAPMALPASPAHALVPWRVVSYSGGYVPADITIRRGDTMVLVNADATGGLHDITSLDSVGGLPLFRSATIGFRGTATVANVEFLEPSVYPYYCSVHEFMTGTITVTAIL